MYGGRNVPAILAAAVLLCCGIAAPGNAQGETVSLQCKYATSSEATTPEASFKVVIEPASNRLTVGEDTITDGLTDKKSDCVWRTTFSPSIYGYTVSCPKISSRLTINRTDGSIEDHDVRNGDEHFLRGTCDGIAAASQQAALP